MAAPSPDRYCTPVRLSGVSVGDACVLAYRSGSPRFPLDEELESLILRLRGGVGHIVGGGPAWLSDAWMSPSGRIFAAGAMGGERGVHLGLPDSSGLVYAWRHMAEVTPREPAMVEWIWGLHDEYVFAWGGGLTTPPQMWLFEGRSWREIPSPGRVYGMHGTDPGLVVAVGRGGLVSRWDGADWQTLGAPSALPIQYVWVDAEDSVFAAGLDGTLYEGSTFGLAPRAYLDATIYGMARHGEGGPLCFAAGLDGLFVLDRGAPRLDYPLMRAYGLDASGDTLLYVRSSGLESTVDRAAFEFVPGSVLAGPLGAEYRHLPE